MGLKLSNWRPGAEAGAPPPLIMAAAPVHRARLAEGVKLCRVGKALRLGYQPVAVLVQEGVRLHGVRYSGKRAVHVYEHELVIRVWRQGGRHKLTHRQVTDTGLLDQVRA